VDGAIAQYKEALKLDPRYALARANLARAERMRELLVRLSDFLAGRAEPKSVGEACEFAYLCSLPFVKQYAAAVRLYEKVLTTDANLARDLRAGYRYNAACCAARAACGDGGDAPTEAAARSALRGKSLTWLRADLAAWTKMADSGKTAERQMAQQNMRHWQRDPDLSGVRHPWSLLRMPTDERRQWQQLWADVDALCRKVATD
jgi:hypothetical protein